MRTGKSKILVIDDESSFTRIVKVFFEDTGRFEVKEVNKGTEGLTAAQQFRPDLILLDIYMPDLCGGEVAAQIREDKDFKDVPIVFLTALIRKNEQKSISGCSYIAKPIRMKDLMNDVERHLQQSNAQNGQTAAHRIKVNQTVRDRQRKRWGGVYSFSG
ncbi:MAG: response regulator [Deltaproteobacteria bacterium]|nr:response regulator [Deltaproteobacteria bacterium]